MLNELSLMRVLLLVVLLGFLGGEGSFLCFVCLVVFLCLLSYEFPLYSTRLKVKTKNDFFFQ